MLVAPSPLRRPGEGRGPFRRRHGLWSPDRDICRDDGV